MARNRRITWVWVGLVLGMIVGCGGRSTPPVVTPPVPVGTVQGVTLDEAGRAVPGVLVTEVASGRVANNGGRSDGNGYWAFFDIANNADFRFEAQGWATTTRNLPVWDQQHRVHLTRVIPPHPDPVKGAIRVLDGGRCFADDSGCRTFTIIHAGDLPLRWHAGGDAQVLADLDEMAAAGYTVVRSWSHIRPGNGAWSRGGSPPYNGLDALNKPDFVAREVALINEVAKRGMRMTLETGGIDGINTSQEQAIMRRFNDALKQAGAWKVAWVSPVNEPSSVHGTSDDNGDVDPGHLRMLVDLARAGTSVLWHLGHAGGDMHWDDGTRFAQKRYTPTDQPMGYAHMYRGGRVPDKIRHRFSVLYEAPGDWKRLWVDGEGVGAPVCGGSLRCVSATQNGQEMNSAEALAGIVAIQSLRGIGSEMSGNGVQRYQDWSKVVGFREVPWTVRQLPRDVHTFSQIFHSGEAHRDKRILRAHGEVRIDCAKASDGRAACVIYGPAGSYRLQAERGFVGKLCDPGRMTCQNVSFPAGGTLPVSFQFDRLLVGRQQ